jgi:large subunit ribosomal protein L2
MTSRGIGGGHKQRYRIIDFKRDKIGVPATVEAIEYDPNRSARIALLKYTDGEKRYIIAPMDLKVGGKVMSGPDAELATGNALPLKKIMPGMPIHNIELHKGKGGQLCRSAAMAAQITASEGEYVTVKLPSGELRLIHSDCYATIGQVGNPDHVNIMLGKAGRNRWLGRRGISRGVARNPVDHPMGGGQGKSKGGGGWHHPVSPWGKLAKGGKSRRRKKYSNAFIIERRKK